MSAAEDKVTGLMAALEQAVNDAKAARRRRTHDHELDAGVLEDYCLSARLDGPDHQPYLCERPHGHEGPHRVSQGDWSYEWPRVAPRSPLDPEAR